MMSLWYPPGRQKSKCSKNVKIQNMQEVHTVWWWSKWKAKGKLACMLFAVIHWVLGCSQGEFLDIWLLIRGRIQRNDCNDFSEKTSVKIQFFNTVTAPLSNSFLETKMLCFHWIRWNTYTKHKIKPWKVFRPLVFNKQNSSEGEFKKVIATI